MFSRDLQCMAEFGEPGTNTVRCTNKAAWRVIMRCCGHIDFLCNDCYQEQRSPVVPPGLRAWYMCGGCHHKTWRWSDAVASSERI